MFRSLISLCLSLALTPVAASAQEVAPCDWRASADGLVEPWETHTRTFANGDVRLAVTDRVEPAAGSFHLVILSPPYDVLGSRQCVVVSLNEFAGFAGIDFANLSADYDPANGLIFGLPVRVFVPDTGEFDPAQLWVILNQSTGDVHASLAPPGH